VTKPRRLEKFDFVEACGVVVLVASYLLGQRWMEGNLILFDFVLLLLASWLLWRMSSSKRTCQDFGLEWDDANRAWPVLGPALVLLLLFGAIKGKTPVSEIEISALLLTTLLYLPWGCLQALIFQGLFHEKWLRARRPTIGLILTTLLFVGVHYPSEELMKWTLPGGFILSFAYAQSRSVWPIGIFHGIAGAWLYFVVLGRPPVLQF
jgi:hypothetical protein